MFVHVDRRRYATTKSVWAQKKTSAICFFNKTQMTFLTLSPLLTYNSHMWVLLSIHSILQATSRKSNLDIDVFNFFPYKFGLPIDYHETPVEFQDSIKSTSWNDKSTHVYKPRIWIERWSKEGARKIEPSKVKNFTFSLMQIRCHFISFLSTSRLSTLSTKALDDCEIILVHTRRGGRNAVKTPFRTMNALADLQWMDQMK